MSFSKSTKQLRPLQIKPSSHDRSGLGTSIFWLTSLESTTEIMLLCLGRRAVCRVRSISLATEASRSFTWQLQGL